MNFRCAHGAKDRSSRAAKWLLGAALLLGVAHSARSDDCSDFPGGVLDGAAGTVPPVQLNIDQDCRVQNYTQANPFDSNVNFDTDPGDPNSQRYLIIYNNVYFTGQMSCNDNHIHNHRLWFTNGTIATNLQPQCRDLFIPVEKIDKQNPAGQTTATIGVPFTYTHTMPVMWDPITGTIISDQGSLDDLHGVTVTDDLNESAAELSYVSHVAYWEGSGTPLVEGVDYAFTNVGGLLTWELGTFGTIIPAGEQIVIELTVVLDDDPTNVNGLQFINTARWDFGRLIDGVFYEPLPGENGITPPMTIAAPELVVSKTGPATMNLGEWGDFVIDVANAGVSDAWDVSLRDRFPNGATGGMCDQTPEILSAQVFAADGVTPVPGKPALNPGTDYTLGYSAAPSCVLNVSMLTPAGVIGPNERLIVRYRTQLDSDTQDGVALTNVAGAIRWFNGDNSNPDRQPYTRTLTDGTPAVADHEDPHTVTVALTGYFFEKTVADLTSGASPAATAAPGDTLRYTLRFRSFDDSLSSFRIRDELDALNPQAVFVPGSLTLVTYPAGADVGNTSPTGGANGGGIVDIRNLSLPVGGELLIQFDVTLAASLANGTVVTNQSRLVLSNGSTFALSDDPNVNGTADPDVSGDEDPTRVTIASSAFFIVQKTSTDLTGDPAILLAGETLRYTITVRNVGNDDAVDAALRDAVPVNTAYVAGSTTLNGTAVADAGGISPLVNGMPIYSPADPTPGSMLADPSANPANVATIAFDVVVDPNVIQGTIVCNQGFVTALNSGIVDYPSDNPDTSVANDPTCDIVGPLPLLYAEKRVVLFGDLATPGVVDPGDTLRYTITVQNSGAVPATGTVLTDSVPANTAYVANTTLLNGLPVVQPDGGVSPLAAGIDISSSDLTPPLPGASAGIFSPGATAVLQFELRVDDDAPPCALISNQAVLGSTELPDLLTDGDGNPATGPEPTLVALGDCQQLSIAKQVAVVGGGPAVAGSTLEYVVQVVNIGAVPAFNVVIRDDLDATQPGYLAYVAGSATLNGSTSGVSFAGTTITADYAQAYGTLEPGATVVLRFRAIVDPGLADGTTVTNTGVVYWNDPTQTASASVSIVVGVIPGISVLGGAAWHDANFNDVQDLSERELAGWTVELYRDGSLLHSTLTDTEGAYRIVGVAPNDVINYQYELRFRAPGAGVNTAPLGIASSPFTNALQRISDIIVPPNANVLSLNLPIDPNGVVYNSVSRTPVAGATLTLLNAGSGAPLPDGCFYDASQQGQATLADGYYKFDVNFSDAACTSGANYVVSVEVPAGTTYVAGYSQVIPPSSDSSTAAFSVPACPGSADDVIPGTALFCEVQGSEFAPAATVPARSGGTVYHVHLVLDDSRIPGSAQIFNNHIPLDPELSSTISITKTTPLRNVARGQLVPYVITVNNSVTLPLTDVAIVDRFPAGFRYVEGSARIDGVAVEPVLAGRELTWGGLTIAGTAQHTLKLLLAVGAGVGEGEFVNRAQVIHGVTGNAMSGEATATVRVAPDPTFDCTDVTGKVFDDVNRNGLQEQGETGLPGVRVVTARGLVATTDQYGRYHITCAATPDERRGSNFVVKLDDRTLPSGFRLSGDQVQIKRATRGKALRFNFGASIHRVVGFELADAVFEPGSTEIRIQWRGRISLLVEELMKAPAVLRLSYLADVEDAELVDRRVESVQQQITQAWTTMNCCDRLTIEREIFWRLGGPPKQPGVREPEGR
jgi:large repetitive protein